MRGILHKRPQEVTMPYPKNRSDKDRLADLIEIIGAEPRGAEFDDEGHLIELNLAGLNLTSLPPEIGQFAHLQSLVLGEIVWEQDKRIELGNKVTHFPPEIAQLTNLQTLALQYNGLTALPPEVTQLINLQTLALQYNGLTALPPEVTQLINLQELDLSSNSLTALSPEIGQLTNLQDLYVGTNNLTALPPEIGQLTNLRRLYVNSNRLTTLPSEIDQLTELQELILSHNNVAPLPFAVFQLANLRTLYLHKNGLTFLPSEIGQLTTLQGLYLGNNALKTLPPEIGQLINLQELYVNGNRLTTLPPEVGQLTNLRCLTLYDNSLTLLPPEIGQLTNLQELYVNGNRLTTLPPEITQLTNLRFLGLSDNPLRTPPPEIAARGKDDTFDFLRDLAQGSVTRYEAKLLMVGEGGTGKTSLLRALRGEPFVEGLSSTHGIDVKPYCLPYPDRPGEAITLHMWDFGGQQIYHTTHQFFMTKRSLYLLVWNARGDTDQARLDHWLEKIKALAPDAPVLLLATHIDERPADFNYERFKEAYPQLVGHIGVSNKDGTGIEELKEIIAREAVELPLMEQQWPKTWVAAEGHLRDNPNHHISLAEYTDTCTEQGVAAEIAQTALGGYLHDLGKILYYQDDDTLCDFVVLKPNWLTRAISRVLDDDITREKGGILAHADFPRIWDIDENGEPYERRLYPCFLRLMERFLMSFKLDTKPPDQQATHSLVPLLLPHSPPEGMPPWSEVLPDQPEVKMVFRLAGFVPPGIMSWFIVLTNPYTQGLHWREGVRLQYKGHQAQVVLNPSKRELWLHVRGPAPSNFFNILQHTINDRILEHYFEGLEYVREVPCNCHVERGDEEPCPYFHDYERLAERMKKGKLTAECGVSFEEVSVPVLLEGIHYTTDDRVAARLKESQETLLQIVEITSENQRLLTQQAQWFELLNRRFTRLWNLQMHSLNAECPNTFVLMPSDRSAFSPKNLFSTEYTLYLMCQHPSGPHIVSGQKGYPIPQSKEWWATIAPWLKRLMDYLRYIPKVRAVAKAYNEEIFKSIETSLNIFEAVLDTLPEEIGAADTAERLSRDRSRFKPFEAEGPALRALHSFLKEVDKQEQWCGLHKTVTNDGNIFWLYEEHRKLHEVS
jgi:internalin A